MPSRVHVGNPASRPPHQAVVLSHRSHPTCCAEFTGCLHNGCMKAAIARACDTQGAEQGAYRVVAALLDQQVKRSHAAADDAAALPLELHVLNVVVVDAHGRLVHVEEGLVQRVQEAVVCLVAAAHRTAITCRPNKHNAQQQNRFCRSRQNNFSQQQQETETCWTHAHTHFPMLAGTSPCCSCAFPVLPLSVRLCCMRDVPCPTFLPNPSVSLTIRCRETASTMHSPAWFAYVSVLARVILAADRPRRMCANTVCMGPV